MRYVVLALVFISLQAETVDEVIEYTLKHNYQLQILREKQEIGDIDAQIDSLWSNPILKIGINDIQSDEPFNRDREAMQNQFISISQTIPLSTKFQIASQIERERVKVLKEQEKIVKNQIIFNIRKAFIEATYAKKNLDILNQYITFLKTPLDLLVRLSAVDRNTIEKYINTELLKKSYQLKLEQNLEQIAVAKETIELIGNIQIESFDGDLKLQSFNYNNLQSLLERVSNNPILKKSKRLQNLANKNLRLAEAKQTPDMTITGGIYQRVGRDDYLSFSLSFPLFIRDRELKEKVKALKRVHIQNITHKQREIELQQTLKIYLHKLNSIEQDLLILDITKKDIRRLIKNAEDEIKVGGSLIHYYELFKKRTDNLLAINENQFQKALIENKIMEILGE